MTFPFHYNLPPAGHKIPAGTVARSLWELRNAPDGDGLAPLRAYLGMEDLLYVSSGRAALWLALKAFSRINPGRSEVIIPAYSCPAVASAVLKAGLKPVLSDNDPADFGFLQDDLEKRVSKDVLAVVLVHLLGYPADISRVKEVCKEYNVFLVEDAAQAFGNSSLDAPVNKLGLQADAGFFSFGRGKPISLMHGGILVVRSEEILADAARAYAYFNHRGRFPNLKYGALLGSYSVLSNPYLYWIPRGIPWLHLGETIFDPDFVASAGVELAGVLAGRMIESLESEKEVRRTNSEWFSSNLDALPWVEAAPSARFPYLRYPLFVKDRKTRDALLDSLMSRGTGAALFYPWPLNEVPGLSEVLKDGHVYPNAKKLSETLITLPVHSGLTDKVRNRIMSIVLRGADG